MAYSINVPKMKQEHPIIQISKALTYDTFGNPFIIELCWVTNVRNVAIPRVTFRISMNHNLEVMGLTLAGAISILIQNDVQLIITQNAVGKNAKIP